MKDAYEADWWVELGKRLRQARKWRGWSQEQLAVMLDLHRPVVSEMEAGRRRITAREAVQICTYLECDLEYLLACDLLPRSGPRRG